jgi:repressor LexA
MIASMSDPADWRTVADEVERRGRGTKLALAKHLEMDPSYLSRKLSGGGFLTVPQARAISAFLADEMADSSTPTPPTPGRRVPVWGYAAASNGDKIAMNNGEVIDWVELPAGLAPQGEVFIVRALGSSMEPRIFDGESLLIRRGVPPTRDRDALIEFNDGSGVVKTYRGTRDGQVFVHQFNPDTELRYPVASVKATHAVFCRL